MGPPLFFGHGWDNSQGSNSSWSQGYVQCKPVQVDKTCVATHIGMRFGADLTKGVKVRMAIFSEVDVAGTKRPEKMLMACPIYEGQGTGETGVKEFKLNKDLKLAPGGYFILTVWSDSPGSNLDYKPDVNGCTFYVAGQNLTDSFENWAGANAAYQEYTSNWSWWIKGKTLGGDREELETFVRAMDEHLKPSESKSYFPTKPDDWDEPDEKQACFQIIHELGSVDAQKYMLEQFVTQGTEDTKININFIGPDGLAPLHAAAYYGHPQLASALVEAKANLQVRTGDALLGTGRTPLMLAALGNAPGSFAVLELLLAKGADVNAEDSVGSTALQLAATRGGPAAAIPLLKTKVQIDHQDSMGYSALLNAAHYGQAEVFSLLVKQKANLKLKTKEGKNAMHLCTQHNRPAVLQLLMDAEAFSLMEEKDNSGSTPLDVATEMRNPEILSYMSAACAGLGRPVNIGTEAGDGARHLNEANKISCTRVVPQFPNVIAAEVGIHWDASNDWKGEGELMAAIFAEGADGEPDFSKCLAECKGKVNANENRGRVALYPLLKPVPLTKGVGYWVAFTTTIDTIVEKDSRIKLINRRYAQHDFKEGFKNLPKEWKRNMCTPAVFIRTAAKERPQQPPPPAAAAVQCRILK